jgi:hypothetical protein
MQEAPTKKPFAPNLSEVPQADAFHGRQNWRPEVQMHQMR